MLTATSPPGTGFPESRLAHLSLLEGSATREAAPGLHRGQKVCPTRAIPVTLKINTPWIFDVGEVLRRDHGSDSTLNNRVAKRLGLS